MVVIFIFSYLRIIMLNKNLLVIHGDGACLHASHPVLTMDSPSQAFTASGLFSLMMSKCRGADGNKTLLEEMKYTQLVAVYLFI